MALPPSMYQSLAQPRYGERMMYDGAPIMGDFGLLDSAMLAPAAQPMTQEDRDARRIAANTPPQGTLITSSLSNKGNATGFGQGNTFRVRDDQEVRITDNKGKVLFSGFGPEAARQAVALGQSITNEKGNKAGWMIQTGDRTINADGTVGSTRWNDVAREKVNKSVLGKIADVALPVAASFIPGIGPVLGAALGSAASSVAQGRSLENTLLRAGLAAGGSALGGQVFGQAASGGSAPIGSVNADLIPNALQGLNFGGLASASIPAGVGGAVGDIIVNAAPSLLGSAAGSAVASAVPSLISAPPSAPVEQPAPTEPEEIVVTGNVPTVTPDPGLGSALAGLPAVLGTLPMDAALAAGTPPSGKDGVLGTGLTIPQLLSIGGVGADLLKNLLTGGGGAGAGAPYVSPFGTGVGFAPGQDMRANPTIMDYERYGFGPEAMFFQPGYGLFSAGAAPQAQPIMAAPQAQPAMITNPRYEPLI